MSELNKLEAYLKLKNIRYQRIDKETGLGFHQVVAYDKNGKRLWDAVCHEGSYGYKDGLLEIMGTIVPNNVGDTVEGWLTADDVIERIEERERSIDQIAGTAD